MRVWMRFVFTACCVAGLQLSEPVSLKPLTAQAPVITPAGDPSVKNDSLYTLVVDPAAHPDNPYVFLLDDGVVRYEADGRGTRTYRQVAQILTQGGVADWAEQSYAYEPRHQRLTVNWIRVVEPDGTVVSDAPSLVQDSDVPAALADPVYSDRKVRRVSLSGVAPGRIVDVSFTLEELEPYLPGDFHLTWSVHTGAFTRRSRYIVDLPAALEPRIVERNLTFRRRTSENGGRRVHLWAAHDVAPPVLEPFAADSNDVSMSIEITGPLTWQAIARWYAGLARGQYGLTPEVRAKAAVAVAGAVTADDSLRALHRWVAQDLRYVSIALGIGGYRPRTPAEVTATGYGDCKDKTTLFVALAGHFGFRAYPVLLNAAGDVERRLPSLGQFNHVIAAVERPGGLVYLDLTSDLTPFGALPPEDQGRFALVVHPDGSADEVTLPQNAPGDNLSETAIKGELAPDGRIVLVYEERALGSRQYALRTVFSSPLDSTKRADLARALATRLFPGASGDSLQVFDGRDLTAEPRLALRVSNAHAAKRAAGGSGTMILTLPFAGMASMADAAEALSAKGARSFPIDVAQVIGPVTGLTEVELILPPGWQAHLPPPVEAAGVWGRFAARYTQEGRTLRITRRLEGARGVQPPEAVSDLIAWLRAVAKDDAPFLVLETAAAP